MHLRTEVHVLTLREPKPSNDSLFAVWRTAALAQIMSLVKVGGGALQYGLKGRSIEDKDQGAVL